MTRILLLGCGKMGGAMLAGWLARDTAPQDVVVIEPNSPVTAPPNLRIVKSGADVPVDFKPDVVVVAVKPQMMDQAIPSVAGHKSAMFLSIAAGKTIGYFEKAVGANTAVVRSMPNTPAAVGRGITVAVANSHVSAAQRKVCDTLLAAVGEVGWVEDEALIDAVTAVSGSGPAYVFLLTEAMTEAGIAVGLSPELAERLARATVSGAGELMRQSAESAGKLRENVTSPAGTTFAALQVLRAPGGMNDLLKKAVAAAAARSKELAG